ncbi:MAG: disulfide bond formation protein B [Candidatus Adiutrix sp.]|jgi:disulfide bond formation protein DsbB|nr:disulfide bond formation protein B [Candidatus Adiutrix sp.]
MLSIWNALRGDFWGTFGRWQDQRAIWLLGGGIALGLELFSWAFFQTFLGLRPCELCVYIRVSMLGIFLGAMIGAMKPKHIVFKLAGYAVVWWWIIRGLLWNFRLEIENIRAADPNWFSLCGPTPTEFPFGLKLDEWFPAHFRPEAVCGEIGNAWSALGLNMAEWLFFAYAGFIIVVALMGLGGLVQARRKH